MNGNLAFKPGDLAPGLAVAAVALFLIPSLVNAPLLLALAIAAAIAGRFGAKGLPAAGVIGLTLVLIQMFVYDLGNPTIRSAAESFDAFVSSI